MSNKTKIRRVSAARLRNLLDELVDGICNAQDRVTLDLSGNTFNIHLDDATVNITVNLTGKGGEA